jgi:hypothetical protein
MGAWTPSSESGRMVLCYRRRVLFMFAGRSLIYMSLPLFTKLHSDLLRRFDLPKVLVLVIAFILWMVFYPAYMNADSVTQYSEGVLGIYDDWHPPIMSIVVHYVHRLGGGIGMITLLQVMSGCFGIYLLSREIMRSWSASPRAIRWYPFFLLVFLLTPFTPLPFYLMGFIKDSWVRDRAYLGGLSCSESKANSKEGIGCLPDELFFIVSRDELCSAYQTQCCCFASHLFLDLVSHYKQVKIARGVKIIYNFLEQHSPFSFSVF